MASRRALYQFITQIGTKARKLEQSALEAGLEDHISVAEIYLIECIGPDGAEKMRDVAAQLDVTLATLTVACDKLESKGLVCRRRDRNDRRTVRVFLTPRGLAAYHFHCSFMETMVDAMQEDLTPGEREQLISAVEKINLFFIDSGR